MINIVRNKVPLPSYQKLSYHPGHWLLHRINGQHIKYKKASICFEGGIFILLRLQGISPEKKLVIFNDQITADQQRMLKFIASKQR